MVVYDNTNTNVEAFYQVQEASNVLVIVLGVLGGVLFVALIIAAIYIIRNTNFGGQARSSRMVRPEVVPNLTD